MRTPKQHTKRGMLKGECDNILDPFNRHRKRISWKALADYDFDAAEIVSGVPVILLKELLTKVWEFKRLLVSVLGHSYGSDELANSNKGRVYRNCDSYQNYG
ncbi:hypothetical protein Trco_001873 [Trichoderma cornu-damae]|uniref:Uncharacterized protein n=1 Tax=Trichoderma cornu-damae TaxID=654480 RepID=A0A9P8TXX4_9HYPO|nr:hypothetical protein Trco_001873 [Trichoderma cornu-damae]